MASSLSSYFVLVFFCFTYEIVESKPRSQRSNRSDVEPFCSRKCTNLESQSDNEDIPLYQCSCSSSCSIYGDCCFDSPYRNNIMQHSRHFICLSVVGHGRYKAVSGCPPNEAADFCKDGLGHLPPVTSKLTNITYANIFCAKCNGYKEDLITWNAELRCPSTANTSAKYIYESGNIWSLNDADGSKAICKYYNHYNDSSFLEKLELRSCKVHTRKMARCSSSWKDPSVLQLCRSYEDPVYFHNTAFRNAHCAQCNYLNPGFADCIPDHVKYVLEMGVVDAKVKKFCRTRGSVACIHSLSDNWKGRQYAFADLLNINEKTCVPPQGKRCCAGETFDFRSQRCRKIRN